MRKLGRIYNDFLKYKEGITEERYLGTNGSFWQESGSCQDQEILPVIIFE